MRYVLEIARLLSGYVSANLNQGGVLKHICDYSLSLSSWFQSVASRYVLVEKNEEPQACYHEKAVRLRRQVQVWRRSVPFRSSLGRWYA